MSGALENIIELDRLVAHQVAAGLRPPWLTRFMQGVTPLGSAYVSFPAYGAGLIFGRPSLDSIIVTLLAAEMFLFPLVVILRYVIRRERPSVLVARPWEPWNRYAFPSYHAARMGMLALVVSASSPDLLGVMIIVALLVGFSRLYLQKHYLSDVLAGSLAGVFSGMAASAVLGIEKMF
jgi:undecaprenyl-diphosphatase